MRWREKKLKLNEKRRLNCGRSGVSWEWGWL